ncbi:hypothetical protein C791_0038 [Amycolatopsis azurea DSM 43854]|uniref:Uncharacterized protein n=1 Tax=Amycolatopsis azurea DSM 43854 TaxID=1238180 RepID=M2PZI4_9PSEU|nr:hypothetical protein C791_0038 [Amycolatopsis azurea DSM 43854]
MFARGPDRARRGGPGRVTRGPGRGEDAGGHRFRTTATSLARPYGSTSSAGFSSVHFE